MFGLIWCPLRTCEIYARVTLSLRATSDKFLSHSASRMRLSMMSGLILGLA